MLEAMNYPQPATQLYGDVTDKVKVKRSKAFDKAYHWTRDKAKQGILEPIHIATEVNASDYMTKALGISEHRWQVVKLTMFPDKQQANTCS